MTARPTMTALAFDPVGHIYTTEDGQVIPSVTKIMAPLDSYYRASEKTLRPYAGRGHDVHALTEFYDNTGDKPDDMNPQYAGYLKGWVDFRRDHGFEPIAIEERVIHEEHLYAGTIDRVGRLRGRMSIVDVKTSQKLGPAVGVQLAAYVAAWNDNPYNPKSYGRFAVQLSEDGTYRLIEYDSPRDWPAFLACLDLKRWIDEVKGAPPNIQFGDVRPRVIPIRESINTPDLSVWSQFTRTAQRG